MGDSVRRKEGLDAVQPGFGVDGVDDGKAAAGTDAPSDPAGAPGAKKTVRPMSSGIGLGMLEDALKAKLGDGATLAGPKPVMSFVSGGTPMALPEPEAAKGAKGPAKILIKPGNGVSKAEAKELEKLARMSPESVRAYFGKLSGQKQSDVLVNAKKALGEDSALYQQLAWITVEPPDLKYATDLAELTPDQLRRWNESTPQSVKEELKDVLDQAEPTTALKQLANRLNRLTPVQDRVAELVKTKERIADPADLTRTLNAMTDEQLREYAGSSKGAFDLADSLTKAGQNPWGGGQNFYQPLIARLREAGGEMYAEETTAKTAEAYGQSFKLLSTGGPGGKVMTPDQIAAKFKSGEFKTQNAAKVLAFLSQQGKAGSAEYQALLKGTLEHLDFKLPPGVTGEQKAFYDDISKLKGEGTARIKGDVLLKMNKDLEAAASKDGFDGSAKKLGDLMGKVVGSDPSKVMRYLELDPVAQHEVPAILKSLVKFDVGKPSGKEIVGDIVAHMAADAAKRGMANPKDIKNIAYQYGQFMSHLEEGLKSAWGDDERAIKEGADILRFASKALGKAMGLLGVPEDVSKGLLGPVNSGIDWLEDHEKAQNKEKWDKVQNGFYQIIDSAYKGVADPSGDRAAAAADSEGDTDYEKEVSNFERELAAGIRDGEQNTKKRTGGIGG